MIRPASPEDLEAMVQLETEVWGHQGFTEEHFRAHFEVLKDFPEFLQVAIVDGRVVGVGVAQLMKYDLSRPIPNWYEATDNGFLRRSFDPKGNVVYGVSLTVLQRFGSYGIGRKIIEAAKKLVTKYQREAFILGSRIPRFYKYATKMSVEEYVFSKKGSRYLDPEIEFYRQCGLQIVKILPEYFTDPESLNYGVLLVWS